MEWITVVVGISGLLLGWMGKGRTVKQDIRDEASADAQLRADLTYIRQGVDDMRLEQRAQAQRYDALAERVTRAEESTKQAHRRIDRLEGGKIA